MVYQSKSRIDTDHGPETLPMAAVRQRQTWTAPSVTVVDLARLTQAGADGSSDGGIFS